MKKLCIFLIWLMVGTGSAGAHSETTNESFFTIDGELATEYPIETVSYFSNDFVIPADAAPATYIVNKPIVFEISPEGLRESIPEEVLPQVKYVWDYGDKTKGQGLRTTHIYRKQGSYLLTVHADFAAINAGVPPRQIQSILIHVLPTTTAQLPRAVIKVNGEERESYELDFGQSVRLEAVTDPAIEGATYYWDLGDIKTSKERVVEHTYKTDLTTVRPAVRIRTPDGYVLDSTVVLNNRRLGAKEVEKLNKKSSGSIYIDLTSGLIMSTAYIVSHILKARRNGSR